MNATSETQSPTQSPFFREAQRIWPKGRAEEMNLFCGFRAVFDVRELCDIHLAVTASSVYRAYLNGEFLMYGPARGPKGMFRVDEISLAKHLQPGRNVLAIEVAGYNVNSYYLLNQPAFCQAEVRMGDTVLAATGIDPAGFQVGVLGHRVQRVARYGFQRPFSEAYRMSADADTWRVDPQKPLVGAEELETFGEAPLLPRGVDAPSFHCVSASAIVARERIELDPSAQRNWQPRWLAGIEKSNIGGYLREELDLDVARELDSECVASSESCHETVSPGQWTKLAGQDAVMVDFGIEKTGFLRASVRCDEPTILVATFDEILIDGTMEWRRYNCINALWWELPPGEYALESFEPYSLRYARFFVRKGRCALDAPALREYVNAHGGRAVFSSPDIRLHRLFEAGRETFVQNAVDVPTDCPGRERAGWLCDSFFTARAARDLCGQTDLERTFLENYALAKDFAPLPDGMLPMCYPADHPNTQFIPNWALWFVIQLEEYLARSGDRPLVDTLQERVEALFRYFEPLLNSDGLLEKLESWVFLEWSRANEFTQDVNYPSNMIYACALEAAGRLYGREDWLKQAECVRSVIREQSFDGEFFRDHAIREEGQLNVASDRTEVCQYYAFFSRTASPQSHPDLWRVLLEEFGPDRQDKGLHPDIHPANAFIGNILRLEILSRYGLVEQMLEESVGYLDYQARSTGTLWENNKAEASCNHGFASHVCHLLLRDVLGVREIDTPSRTVRLHWPDISLPWCGGRVPLINGTLEVLWERTKKGLFYRVEQPEGWTVDIQSPEGVSCRPFPQDASGD